MAEIIEEKVKEYVYKSANDESYKIIFSEKSQFRALLEYQDELGEIETVPSFSFEQNEKILLEETSRFILANYIESCIINDIEYSSLLNIYSELDMYELQERARIHKLNDYEDLSKDELIQ
eukprot:758956-Hanusia_phi.AAC.1